jgi:hypothetical protein
MKPTRGRQGRWLLVLGGAALAVATNGCALLIHDGYQTAGYDWPEIAALQTRGEVHEKLGKPADAFTCPDGTYLDSYHLRKKLVPCSPSGGAIPGWCTQSGDAGRYVAVILVDAVTLGMAEAIMTPAALVWVYQQERSRDKLHVGLVYDAEGRLLSRSDAAPGDLAGLVLGLLTEEVSRVRADGCPSWQSCLARPLAETRRRATCTGYTLTPEEKQRVEWVERIAEDVDAERLAQEAGRDALAACYLSSSRPCPLADGN